MKQLPLALLMLASLLVPSWSQAANSPGSANPPQASSSTLPALTLVEPYWEGLDDNSAGKLKRIWKSSLAQASSDLSASFRILTIPALGSEANPTSPRIRAVLTGEAGSYTALFQLEGLASAAGAMKYCPFEKAETGLYLEFARAIEALARYLMPPSQGQHPVLVDSFSPADLQGVDLSVPAASLYPYGIAGKKDGHILVACGYTVLELDERWQVTGLPAKTLSDEGNNSFAFGLALTPAGTLIVRSADGSGAWSFAEGSAAYQRLRLDIPAGSVFGVMGDGSPFVVALQPRMARVWRGGQAGSAGEVLDLPLAKDATILAAAAGPDDTLWLADTARASIRIMTPDGVQRDIVYPELPQGTVIMKLRVLADGSFIAATGQDLRRFDPTGRLLWTWDGKAEGLSLNFSTYSDVVPGPAGLFYVSDIMGRRILRIAEKVESLPPSLGRIAAASKATRLDGRKAEPWLALADAYEATGAFEAARVALDRYLELRPSDAKAADRRLAIQATLLKAKAAAGEREVAAIVKRFGPETAREAFTRAMRSLEGLRALLPQDAETLGRISALKKLMTDAEGGSQAPAPLPQVQRVELAALFPSLIQVYRSRPAGAVVLKNSLAEPVTDLKAELFIPKYMDFPSSGATIARLAPGAEARLELSALLSEKVLDVEEDIPVQALVTIRFSDSRGARSFEFTRSLTIFRRTALTWDETGKLASFVTPNEDTIARAAFQMIQGRDDKPLFSRSLQRAAAICDSLGALPLGYVPDPQSAFSAVSGDAGIVDTVRFPRTTLAYQGGDCDDTTALLASLLEAAGLHTAILTSPGHVFLAFDTGERADAAWLFDAPGFETIVGTGTVWIPIESTNLAGGFAKSWKAASELVAKWRGTKDFEFLPLSGLRASWPALPLPPSSLPAPRADADAAAALDAASALDLAKGIYAPVSARLEAERARLQGKDWCRAMNKLAQVHVRYGRPDLATAVLKEVVKRDPAFVSAYLNLATLSIEARKPDEALAWLKAAAAAVPGSALVESYAAKAGLTAAMAGKAAPPGTTTSPAGASAAAADPAAPSRAGIVPPPEWSSE